MLTALPGYRDQGRPFLAFVYGIAAHKVADAHRAATGKELESFMTAGYLDTRVYALYDKIPALCYGPISQNIHGFDERVSLASVKRITTAMALFVALTVIERRHEFATMAAVGVLRVG